MKFELPQDVKYIVNTIISHGYEAYIVGGCVRDILLGVEPSDYDITTSAEPYEIKKIFKKTIDTGLQHGTVTVMLHREGYEVTTYRIDGKYEDYRRPKEVSFTRSLAEDLLRRDFTINAMAYNDADGLVDMYQGREDLQRKRIRCVGVPDERFNEDALRMLRAIRFSAKLGFEIEKDTYASISHNKKLIKHVSMERIQVELNKTLLSPHPEYMEELVKTGLANEILPEFLHIVKVEQSNPYHMYDVDIHTYEGLKVIPPTIPLRWAFYLHDIGKGLTKTTDEKGIDHFYGHQKVSVDLAKGILKRLRFDNKNFKKIITLIEFHDERPELSKRAVRRLLHRMGDENFLEWYEVKKADIKAQHIKKQKESLATLEKVMELYKEIQRLNECVQMKDLQVNGKDLIEIGIQNGKEIGATLQYLLEKVIENPEYNQKEVLLAMAKER